ncbi:hypothetical protein ACFXGA_25465 [Actinosynnema sp. NPDC059335]|uniref:hypothetical protein n=1 Tax=Actinosynnema sp. NPDC059335 TaxID=3346804 RepID=UPI003672E34F
MTNDHARSEHESGPDVTPIDRALQALRRGQPIPPELALDDAQRQLVDDLAPWLDALEAAAQSTSPPSETAIGGAPPVRRDDPVAQMLGLVPDPDVALDGRKLALARKRAKLNLAQFLERLNSRGWDATLQQAFQWEQNSTVLAPALVDAIADELGVDRRNLAASPWASNEHGDLFDDDRVRAFLADWAAEVDVPVEFLRERTGKMLTTAAFRNKTSGSVEGLLGVLRTLRSIPDLLERP